MALPAIITAGALAPLIKIVLSGGTAAFLTFVIIPLAWILLRALGVGAVTYLGLDFIQSQLVDLIQASYGDVQKSLLPYLINFMGILHVDFLFNMIISAFTTRLTINFLCGGLKVRKLKLFQFPC